MWIPVMHNLFQFSRHNARPRKRGLLCTSADFGDTALIYIFMLVNVTQIHKHLLRIKNLISSIQKKDKIIYTVWTFFTAVIFIDIFSLFRNPFSEYPV